MTTVLLLRASSAVLAAAIGLVPLVPPEHVHESEEHGHHRTVVHRHAAPHPLTAPHRSHGRELHDDEPVLTLTAVYTVPGAPALAPASHVPVAVLPEPPINVAFHRDGDSREPRIHGPPRAPASPRAPPRLSSL